MPGCYDGCGCCYIPSDDIDVMVVDEWDMLEDVHADSIVEKIASRGDTSSPASLNHLTLSAVVSAIETYIFNVLSKCQSDVCPLRDIFPDMAQRKHYHWHYAQWLAMYNGLVGDLGYPPTIVKALLPKIEYQKVNYICFCKKSDL